MIALIGGFVALVIVISAALSDEGSGGSQGKTTSSGLTRKSESKKPTPATYVVQAGDTLTSIAHETGVSVVRIQALNPGVDPQILIAGEKLKLR